MSLFGDKADKIAIILDRMYRAMWYKNDYGFPRRRRKFTQRVAISMKHLVKILHEPAAPILDMICYSSRHHQHGTKPIETVLDRVKQGIRGKRCSLYVLAEPYRITPKISRLQRDKPVFKHNKEKMDMKIAGWSENYQTVCNHIKTLTLDMDADQCDELIERIRDKYIQSAREKYIGIGTSKLMARYPKWSEEYAGEKATARWKNHCEKRIKKLDEKNYDKLLFIQDKFLEMEGKDEMPIYSLDPQGRLHYYLTNMSEELRPYIRLDGCKMVSYDLVTSQPVFIWITLREYIRENNIKLDEVKQQANEILDTIRHCNNGIVPDFVQVGLSALVQKRREQTLDDEMEQLGKVLSKDFYADIMRTIEWQLDRKKFKSKVLFPFLYGKKPSWGKSDSPDRKTMMHYFIKKFPAVYCVLWRMRRFTEICRDYYRMLNKGVRYTAIKQYIDETYNTADFPKQMQRVEARMFYDTIIPQIDQPCVTIHDSVIVQSGKKCDVAQIIKQAFVEKYQIEIRVNREDWY
jgi:hypothetical protein